MTVRIAMWSGPRNISTAMMRSFENRPDCTVSDEPFYGCYLYRTGSPHPMASAVIASMDTDFDTVARTVTGPVPDNMPIWYQKHMTHHMLPGDDLSFMDGLANCFLIRDPGAVVASYAAKRDAVTAADIGIERQYELFVHARNRTGRTPPVLDAADVLRDPEGTLSTFCETVGIPFSDAMLSWPPGRRATDGVWADHWYHSVERSTGFKPYSPEKAALPPHLAEIADRSMQAYADMAAVRLKR